MIYDKIYKKAVSHRRFIGSLIIVYLISYIVLVFVLSRISFNAFGHTSLAKLYNISNFSGLT